MKAHHTVSLALTAAIVAVLGTTLPGGHLMAQDAAAESVMEEVIVSARKREESIQEVPIAVTAVGADTIAREQINSIRQVADFSPGLVINSDAVGRAFMSIRGIGTTLIDTVQPGVGIFIDGIYQPNTSYLNNPVLDVERIEVLKGPQGTLFGNNTLGGAINVITRKPTDEFYSRVEGVWADPDNYQTAAATVSGPMIEGSLYGRIAASYHSEDGFSTNLLAGGDARPLDHRSVNGTLVWDAAEAAEITFNAYIDSVEGSQTAYANPAGPTDYREDVTLNLNSIARFDYQGFNLKGVFDLAAIDTELTAVLAYDKKEGKANGDADFGPVDFARTRDGRNDTTTKTAEVRFDTSWTDNISTLIGVFANTSDVTNANLTDLPLFGVFGVPASQSNDLSSWAVFGNLFWDLSAATELSFGLRFDDQEVKTTDNITGFETTYTADEWQPRVTLKHDVSDSLMAYGSVSRGFRGGGANGPGAPNPIYEGDSVWTYEIGSKLVSEDGRWVLNAAAYYNDYSDYIGQNALAPTEFGTFVAVNLNTGDVESYGVELEGSWQATDRFMLQGGVTYLHARITDDSQYQAITGRTLPTDRILFLPDYTYFGTASYTVPLGGDELRFDATVIGKGDRVGSTADTVYFPELEAYTTLNANITWERENWFVSLWGTNLTDEIYFESYIDKSLLTSAGFTGPLVNNLGITSAGRRIGIRVGAHF
ncbi:MAG: TonB-dependent receptor [Gammaproteobacteria bacterium]